MLQRNFTKILCQVTATISKLQRRRANELSYNGNVKLLQNALLGYNVKLQRLFQSYSDGIVNFFISVLTRCNFLGPLFRLCNFFGPL